MPKTIVFQSDFTYKEGAVAAMYGVVNQVDPDLEIIDLTHEIPKFDIWSASFRLHQVVPFWPKGTVFVSVVDPGVGTARKACVAKTKSGHVIVTPDNKTLTHIAKFIGLEEVREIPAELRFASPYKTAVFHGRDVFGYVGALLASGQKKFEEIGNVYSDYQSYILEKRVLKRISLLASWKSWTPTLAMLGPTSRSLGRNTSESSSMIWWKSISMKRNAWLYS